MAKSSTARRALAPLILAAAPGALAAQAVTAEQAIEGQRAAVAEVVSQTCPESPDPNNVVVCGRREQFSRYRVPSADPALAMRPANRAGGEQLRAMDADACLRLCHQPVMVGVVGISADGVTGAIPDIAQAADRLLNPD